MPAAAPTRGRHRFRGRSLGRRQLLALSSLLSLVWVAPAEAPARNPSPCRRSTRGRCYDHLVRGPLRDRLLRARVGRFLGRKEIPRGGRARAKPGDYFIKNRALMAVIRARDGMLIDLALADGHGDRLGWGSVAICDSIGRHTIVVDAISLEPRASPPALVVHGHVTSLGRRLHVSTRYSASMIGLAITTRLRSNAPKPRYNLQVCDHFGLANTPLWVPGRGEIRPGRGAPSWTARWVARREQDVSWALALGEGRKMELDLSASRPYGAFDPVIAARYLPRINLGAHGSTIVRRTLVLARGSLARAVADGLQASGRKLRRLAITVRDGAAPADARVVIAHGGAPYLSGRLEASIALPLDRLPGAQAALLLPGVGYGRWKKLGANTKSITLEPPRRGSLSLTIRSKADDRATPAKVTIEGVGKVSAPDFGRGEGLRVENVIYAGLRPSLVALAPGRYRLTISRGPEVRVIRTIARIKAGQTTAVKATLARAFATPGWISADLHTHSDASFDSPLRSATRLVATAAVGLEFLVATDHNTLTNHRPAITRGGLTGWLKSAVGQEITTKGHRFGHFNAFPLPTGAPLRWYNQTPALLFSALRRRAPGALIQVNHPRMGSIGYFDQLGLDPRGGAARSSLYRAGFDLIEIFNGDDLTRPEKVERNVKEYFALLNRGRRYTATGNSDAHRLPTQDVGSPRNFILLDNRATDDDDVARANPKAIVSALHAHRSQLTTGPFIDFRIEGQPLGSEVAARKGKRIEASLSVFARPDIDVSLVDLIKSGKRIERFNVRGRSTLRLRKRLWLRGDADAWYLVIVRGKQPIATHSRRGVLPFAFSNPIWVKRRGPT